MSVVRIEAHPATASCESCIVSFANGKLNKELSHEMLFGCYRHVNTADPRLSKRRIIVAETADMEYVAKNYGAAETSTTSLSRHYVALVNRAGGTMRVCEARLLLAKPMADNVDNADVDAADVKASQENAAETSSLTGIEKADKLTSTFGSKRKRKAMESRIRNSIKGAILETAVNSAVQKALVESRDADNSPLVAAQPSELLPPHDKDATEVAKAYPLEGIITQAELDVVSSVSEPFAKNDAASIKQWQAENSYCSYILDHLQRLPVKSSQRLRKSSLLMYLHYLFTMHSWKACDLRKPDPFLPLEVPDAIQQKLYEAFTVQSGFGKNKRWSMPSRLKDKLAAYAIVLCLILDEFSFEVTPVQKALALSTQKFTGYVRAVGGVVVPKKSDSGEMLRFAQLRAPLVFPDGSKRRRTL